MPRRQKRKASNLNDSDRTTTVSDDSDVMCESTFRRAYAAVLRRYHAAFQALAVRYQTALHPEPLYFLKKCTALALAFFFTEPPVLGLALPTWLPM